MKRIFIVVAVLVIASASFSQRYVQQNLKNKVLGVWNNYDVEFFDSNNGAILEVGPTGGSDVLRTTDGGLTWFQGTSFGGLGNNKNSLSMGSATTFLAVNYDKDHSVAYNTIYKTTSGGTTPWTPTTALPGLDSLTYSYPKVVSMYGTTFAVAIGDAGRDNKFSPTMYNTTDGGATWQYQFIGVQAQSSIGSAGVGISMGSPSAAVAFYHIYYHPQLFEGVLVWTSDGGKTWTQGNLDPAMRGEATLFNSIEMVNQNVGYVLMRTTFSSYNTSGITYLLARTIDGGRNWARCDNASFPVIGVPSFLNAKKGAMLYGNSLLLTNDSGRTWVSKPLPYSALSDVKYVSDSVLVVVGGGLILRSIDTGTTWTSNQSDFLVNMIRAMAVLNSGTGVAVGGGSTIARTTNKGNDWYYVKVPHNGIECINGVQFVSDSIVVAVCDNNVILRSIDAGVTWKSDTLHFMPKQKLLRVEFLKEVGFGIIVSLSGRVARTFDYGVTWDTLPAGALQSITSNVVIGHSDSTYIYTCSGNKVMYSIDSGMTWKERGSGLPQVRLTSISMINDSLVLVGGDRTISPYHLKVYRHTKNEDVWQETMSGIDTANVPRALNVKMMTPEVALIEGTWGENIYKSTDFGMTWLAESHKMSSSDAILGINTLYAVSPTEIYFGGDNYRIIRRTQGDYKKVISGINFGVVRAEPTPLSKDTVIQITNTGADTLFFSDVYTVNNVEFKLIPPSLSKLLPGETGSQGIRYTPSGVGDQTDSLVLASDALSQNSDTVILNGTGTSSEIAIAVDKDCLDFDSVKVSGIKIRQFKITSTGNNTLHVKLSFQNNKTPPYYFQGGVTEYDIPPNTSVTVNVRCTPTDTGMVRDSVKIESTALLDNPKYICLSGTGLGPKLTVTTPVGKPPVLDYGNVIINNGADSVIHILNSGNDTLIIFSVIIQNDNDDVFRTIPNALDTTKLAPGFVESVNIRYMPYRERTSTAKVVISSNSFYNSGGLDTVVLRGTGVKSVSVGDEFFLSGLSLSQNHPNPFSSSTVIQFTSSGNTTSVFEVRDMLGRAVYQTTVNNEQGAVHFNGSGLPTGVYIYSLLNGACRLTKTMEYIR